MHSIYYYFFNQLEERGFEHLLVASEEEAAKMDYALYHIPNIDNGLFDLFVLGKHNNQFGEFAWFTDGEFEEEGNRFVDYVFDIIEQTHQCENVEERMLKFNENYRFYPHKKLDITKA